MILRPYQEEAKQKVLAEWDKGVKNTLLVLPTGTGKTVVFSSIIETVVKQGHKVLILAHRGELLEQAADKLYKISGLKSSVEKADATSIRSFFNVTVGSVQTLMREDRLKQFKQDQWDYIVIDEAHHVLSESYRRILDYFPLAKVLGVTATPDRGDFKNLGEIFESLAYHYSLPKAIKDGYLAPIKALTIPLKIDLSAVKQQTGDFSASDLGSVLDPYLEAIADEMTKIASDRKTVVFLPLVETSRKFAEILNQKGLRAVEVNGKSEDRNQKIKDFEIGKYNVLCNSMLLTEGWDCPSVDCVVVLRPTKVRSLYSQMIGRGTRLYPGKDHLLILDFLWHSERHKLVHPAHLIAPSEEIAEKATQKLEALGADCGGEDLESLVDEAEKDTLRERERALADKLDEMKKRTRKLVDPLQFEMSIQDEDLADYVPAFGWEMAPPNEKQLQAIEKFGVYAGEVGNAGKAALLLNKLITRAQCGMSTPKQIRFLEKRGFCHVGEWSHDQAYKMIGAIAANGWRTPRHIDPATYAPR